MLFYFRRRRSMIQSTAMGHVYATLDCMARYNNTQKTHRQSQSILFAVLCFTLGTWEEHKTEFLKVPLCLVIVLSTIVKISRYSNQLSYICQLKRRYIKYSYCSKTTVQLLVMEALQCKTSHYGLCLCFILGRQGRSKREKKKTLVANHAHRNIEG